MRIVYITPIFLPSHLKGSEKLIYQFAKAAQSENEVIVLTSNIKSYLGYFFPFIGRYKENEVIIDGMKIIRIKNNWLIFLTAQILEKTLLILFKIKFLSQVNLLIRIHRFIIPYAYGVVFKNLYNAIEKIRPDIVQSTPIPDAYVYQAVDVVKKYNISHKKKIKTVLIPAMHFNGDAYRELYDEGKVKEVFNEIDTILCTTNFEKEKISSIFNIREEKIKVINIGIKDMNEDIKEEEVSNEVKEIISNLKRNKRKVIFFLGVRGYDKGLFNLINALDILFKKNKNFYLMVGGQTTLSWSIHLLFYRFLNKKEYIINLPYLNSYEKLLMYKNSDIFAMPSRVESFGIVYLEAMSNSLPIIYADEPPVREVVGDAGLYSKFEDINLLSKNLNILLKSNKRMKEISKIARQQFMSKYEEKMMFKKLKEIYKI